MATNFDMLSPTKKQILLDYIEELETDAIVENLKVMKKVLNLSFAEERNQIVKPTPDDLLDTYVESGYNMASIEAQRDNYFKNNIETIGGFRIIIHFPEVTITNSRKGSHVIKDLWVKIGIKKNGNINTHLHGLRTTMTTLEYDQRYMHSHLAGFNPDNIQWSHFCLGSGEINQVLMLLNTKFDEINFTLLCLHLKNYVKWESLEGTPHNKMENIISRGGGDVRGVLSTNSCDRIVNILKRELFSIPGTNSWIHEILKLTVSERGIGVFPTEELELWIVEKLNEVKPSDIELYRSNNEWLLALKDVTGNYFGIANTSRNRTRSYQRTPVLKFKGEDKFFTIIDNDNELKTTKYPNPVITEKLCWELTREFTKAAIGTENLKEQSYSISDNNKVAEANNVPL